MNQKNHWTQTMKNLITNPLTRAAIAGAAVWLSSVFVTHGQNKLEDLKQRVIACSDYRAIK
jgi:hypothetical protein